MSTPLTHLRQTIANATMITIKRQDIVGPNKLPGFNRVGEINLENFLDDEIEIPQGYEFESLGSLDLDTEVNELDDMWSNDGVRDKGNTEDRIQALQNGFLVKGYLTKDTPGMGSKEGPVEGRGRALAAKRNGEKKLPWINLTKIEDGETSRVSGGVEENLKHDPATKGTREDVITAGLYLIGKGELEPNEVDIRDWLKDRIHIHKYFIQANVTLILDGIIKRHAEGDNAVSIKERKSWMQVLDKEFNILVDNKTTFLFSIDSPTYSCRCFCEAVLEYGTKTPVDIILYTKRRLPSEARKKLETFVKDIEKYTRLTYKAIGNKRGMKFENVDINQHYKIRGCIPQFIEDHKDEILARELVNIDSY